MLRQFGPSKWTPVRWTGYVTSIWTIQIDDGPMDRLGSVNLDRPNGQRSNGPPMLRQFGPSKITVVDRYFGPSKNTDGDRNFGLSKITVGARHFGRSKITVGDRNFGPSEIS